MAVFRQDKDTRRKLKQKARRRINHGLILAAIGIVFTLVVYLVQPFYTFNLWFSDQFLESDSPSPNIVLAGIDDASLNTFGKWSEWPRSLHTSAINNLNAAGAAVIGYDVIFANESTDDAGLSDAIDRAGNVVLAVAGTRRISSPDKKLTFTDFLIPAASLRTESLGLGHVNIVPDPDGKVRRVPLVAQTTGNEGYPSLGVAMLSALFKMELPEKITPVDNRIALFMRQIPVDPAIFMRLNYAVMDKRITHLSYQDIINNTFDPSQVKNKLVIVGIVATGDVDNWSVPTSAIRVPGVYIHAAVMDTILRMRFITEAGMNTTALIMLLLTGICVASFSLAGTWKWQDIVKISGTTLGLLLLYIFACALISTQGLILNILYPCLVLLALYVSNIIFMVVQQQTNNKFIKELFGRYVSPQISREIVSLADEGKLKLGGEEREVTIMFADIRNFTTLSEKLTPAGVVEMLNTCLPVLIDAIVQNGGLVNKFAGDSLMGVWNAPQAQAEHPKLAVKAGWEAQTRMAELCARNAALAGVKFGIGINTGKAVAGNVGSSGRVEYTVIGDAVNLASRICSATPGQEIMIGPETYNQTQEHLEVEALPPQLFKGKSQPIVIYRVKGWRNQA